MSAPIGPGDWVECVDARPCRLTGERLQMGGLYCVREVHEGIDFAGEPGVGFRLRGLARPLNPDRVEYAWHIDRFRPVYRPDERLTARLLEGLPELVADRERA